MFVTPQIVGDSQIMNLFNVWKIPHCFFIVRLMLTVLNVSVNTRSLMRVSAYHNLQVGKHFFFGAN